MHDLYPFNVDSDTQLIDLEISSSFFKDLYFQVHKCGDDIVIYWRYALSDKEFRLFGEELNKAINNDNTKTLIELSKTKEYNCLLNRFSTIWYHICNEFEIEIIDSFLFDNPPDELRRCGGRDGHTFFLEKLLPTYHKYVFWCCAYKEWGFVKQLIDLLFEVSYADEDKYWLQIYNR